MDWDQYFMSMAYMVAMKSKDQGAKVGSITVDDEQDIITTGFNGFPRGFDDNRPDRLEKPNKLIYTIHAELNACLSAARRTLSLRGARMYVTWAPCDKCALAIVQSGLKEVITHKENPHQESWNESIELGKMIMSEGGVTFREWSGNIIIPVMFKGDEAHPFPVV